MNIKKDLKKLGSDFPQELILPQFGDNFPRELILPQFGDNPKKSSKNECSSKDTSYDAIRQINCREDYNNFAKNLHPDRNYLCPEDANNKFKELNKICPKKKNTIQISIQSKLDEFEKDLKEIKKRLTEYYLAFIIHPRLDFEDLEEYFKIKTIDGWFKFFEDNLKSKSKEYEDTFKNEDGEAAEVLDLIREQFMESIKTFENSSDDDYFKFFDDSYTIFPYKKQYMNLPNYKTKIVEIGKSIIKETEERLNNIVTNNMTYNIIKGGTFPPQLVENACKLEEFIKNIYDTDLIFPSDKNEKNNLCFLRGTFIIEDKNGIVFKLLNSTNCIKNSPFIKTTHSKVKKKEVVEASYVLGNTNYNITPMNTLNAKIKNINPEWYDLKTKSGKLQGFYHYELLFNKPFEFACDKECRDLGDNSTCKESDRDPKKIALMYHFKTKAPESKRFTFIKLETHRNADLNHFVSAISTYALGIDGNPSDYISRRESCNDKCIFSKDLECDENDMCYMPSFRNQYHIQNYLNKMKNDANFEEIKNELYKNLNYYNLNLRTGDELYIPQVITDQLLKILF